MQVTTFDLKIMIKNVLYLVLCYQIFTQKVSKMKKNFWRYS